MDRSLGGKRCRAARRIVYHGGVVPQDTQGTVRHSMTNIGRTLIHVDFDCGHSLPVLPDDVSLELEEQLQSA